MHIALLLAQLIAAGPIAPVLVWPPVPDPDNVDEDGAPIAPVLADEWSVVVNGLSDLLRKRATGAGWCWHAEATGLGKRGLSAVLNFHALDGGSLFYALLPRTDCQFRIYAVTHEGTPFVVINNAHAEAPNWTEWYAIRVATDAELIAASRQGT